MKKLVLETKTALGLTPKTVDVEFDAKVAKMKSVEEILSSYKQSMEGVKLAADNLVQSMQKMSAVFELMVADPDVPSSLKSVAVEHAAVLEKVRQEDLLDFKKLIDDSVCAVEADALVNEFKELVHKRDKILKEYDMYRDAVSTKEAQYAKKGKDLSDSKNYTDSVNKSNNLKAELETVTNESNEKYVGLSNKKVPRYVSAVSGYLDCTSQLITSFEKRISTLKKNSAI